MSASLRAQIIGKVVHVHYASPSKLQELTGGNLNIRMTVDNLLKLIVLFGRAEDVAATERIIQELDESSKSRSDVKDIEVSMYAIGANSQPLPGPQQLMNPALDPVIKQIRATFPYRSFQLLTSSSTRSRTGEQSTNHGHFALGEGQVTYEVSFSNSDVIDANGRRSIHLSKFHFNGSVWHTKSGAPDEVLIATDLDLQENQKTVIGKAGTGSDDSAIFVVLTAKVVD